MVRMLKATIVALFLFVVFNPQTASQAFADSGEKMDGYHSAEIIKLKQDLKAAKMEYRTLSKFASEKVLKEFHKNKIKPLEEKMTVFESKLKSELEKKADKEKLKDEAEKIKKLRKEFDAFKAKVEKKLKVHGVWECKDLDKLAQVECVKYYTTFATKAPDYNQKKGTPYQLANNGADVWWKDGKQDIEFMSIQSIETGKPRGWWGKYWWTIPVGVGAVALAFGGGYYLYKRAKGGGVTINNTATSGSPNL